MTLYATQQDMIDAFGSTELIQVTNLTTPGATTINTANLNRALSDASAEIDGYLQAKYVLPLAVVPTVLVGKCCDIARYKLYVFNLTDVVVDRYEKALSWLREVARGVVNLGLDQSGVAAPVVEVAQLIANERTFTQDGLADYRDGVEGGAGRHASL